MEVDGRLLTLLPFYKELLSRRKPSLRLSEEEEREAFSRALEHAGHAKRTTLHDGTEWLEPTDKYLRYLEEPLVH